MNIKKEKFNISGMHCASCALLIESKLKQLPAVKDANVNFALQRANVEFDCDTCSDESVVKVIKDAGYTASIVKEGDEDDMDHHNAVREAEITKERNVFILSLVLTLPVIILSMVLKDMSTTSRITQALLAGIVQFYIGGRFYRGTYYALKNKAANMDTLVAVGTSAAYFYSLATTFLIEGEVFYETAALLITFVILGKWLEARAKGKTGQAIKKLLGLQAKEATVLLEENDDRLK